MTTNKNSKAARLQAAAHFWGDDKPKRGESYELWRKRVKHILAEMVRWAEGRVK